MAEASPTPTACCGWTSRAWRTCTLPVRRGQPDDAFGFATNTWTWGIEPYDFNLQADYYPQDVSVYLYSDRPIYRPGQPVYFRGVARSRDDVAYTPLGRASVPVRIEDNNGETVYEATLPLTESAPSAASSTWPTTPAWATTGWWLCWRAIPN